MKYLFLFLLPLYTVAQSLKPGVYRDLKLDKPLVLDTGSYTFIHLEMKNLGKGIWLDGRKARSLTVINCRFEGNGIGTGVKTAQNLTVENCNFSYLEYGIMVVNPIQSEKRRNSSEARVSLVGNKFINNQEAILIAHPKTNLAAFRCNRFELDLDNTNRIGLHIGREPNNLAGTSPLGALSGPIGGNGDPNIPNVQNPNANIWPQDPNNPGHSPDGWTSIKKYDGGGVLYYFHYTNEIVGNIIPNSGANIVSLEPFRTARSPRAVLDWCSINHPGDPDCPGQADTYADWPANWNAVCANLDDETDYFPLRLAAGNTTTAMANLENYHPALGDPIPNPAAGKAYLPVFWTREKGTLVVFELTTGKEISRKQVLKGQQMVELDIQLWPAGVYGYRLEGECPCPEPKQLVVIH